MDVPPTATGDLTFDESVFQAIAEHVLDRSPGMRLADRARGGLLQRFRRTFSDGVHAQVSADSVHYDIPVVVRSAGDVRAACRDVQRDVAAGTRKMTGYAHISVNVAIRGIE